MQTSQIQAAQRNGNLFIKLSGDFNRVIAQSTVSTINANYQGSGNIFINTQQLGAVLDTGIAAFKQELKQASVHHSNLFMVGSKGLDIVPEGSQVIVPPTRKTHKCTNCGSCTCGKNDKATPKTI